MPDNFLHKYYSRGKYIFQPTEECRRKGERLLRDLKHIDLPPYFYHYTPGGHVAALHAHISNCYFFKVDIERFYYSIYRNRVGRALHSHGFGAARAFAKWSCVRSPYEDNKYTLPIGFVQSPLLASLVLLQSPVASAIEKVLANGVMISVYFDDFIGSCEDEAKLQDAYEAILDACAEAQLVPSEHKLTPPNVAITAFNCDVAHGLAKVTAERVAKFYSKPRSSHSANAFEEYRARVARNNAMAAMS